MIELVTGIIKPELLILTPLTWVFGLGVKKALSYEGKSRIRLWLKNIFKDTGRIKPILYVTIYVVGVIFGLILSTMEGGLRIADALVIYGAHGVVCTWLATKLYDKVREQ